MTETLPLVRRVRPASRPNTLTIDWKGGGHDSVDLTGLIARTLAFAPLKDAPAFGAVHTVEDGMGIEWDCGLDLSGSTLEVMAQEQRPMAAAEFAGFLVDNRISNREAAGMFGSSESTIKNWRSGRTELSLAVAATVRVMVRDPIVLAAHYRPQTRGRPRKQSA